MTRSRSWILLSALLLGWLAWRVLLTPYGTPSTWTLASDPVTAVSAEGAGIVQDIRLGADGFDGVWVFVEPDTGVPRGARRAPAPPRDGQLLVTLARLGDGSLAPLEPRAMPVSAFGRGPVHLSFRAQRDSRGDTYRLRLQHVGRSQGEPLRLRARRDDAHASGRFEVDGREQWGDLMFTATASRATLPFWLDEILAPWPAWVGSPAVLAGVWLGGMVLLMRASRASVARWRATAVAGVPPVSARRAGLAAAAIVAIGGVTLSAWPSPPLQSIALVDHLDAARIEVASPSVHDALAVQPVALAGHAEPGLIALPPSRLVWRLHLPRGALFVGGVAMRPDVWTRPSDGANLRIAVTGPDGVTSTLAAYTLVPFQVWEHRQRHAFRLSLDQWAGQEVTLTLETDPERWGNAVNDVPVWLDPQIVWPRGPRWGRGRVVEQ